jgi:hypothetical protein
VQSFGGEHHVGHLWGDVPALLLVAIVLSARPVLSGLKHAHPDRMPLIAIKEGAGQGEWAGCPLGGSHTRASAATRSATIIGRRSLSN